MNNVNKIFEKEKKDNINWEESMKNGMNLLSEIGEFYENHPDNENYAFKSDIDLHHEYFMIWFQFTYSNDIFWVYVTYNGNSDIDIVTETLKSGFKITGKDEYMVKEDDSVVHHKIKNLKIDFSQNIMDQITKAIESLQIKRIKNENIRKCDYCGKYINLKTDEHWEYDINEGFICCKKCHEENGEKK